MNKVRITWFLLLFWLLTSCSSQYGPPSDYNLDLATAEAIPTVSADMAVGTLPVKRVLQKQPEPTGKYALDFTEKYVASQSDKVFSDNYVYEEQTLLFSRVSFVLGADAGFATKYNFRTNYFERLVKVFPEPHVTDMGEYYYVFYDTDQGTRLFVYFPKGEVRGLVSNGFPVIMKRALSYLDFMNLALDDSIETVEKIDPIIPIYVQKFDLANDNVLAENMKEGIFLTSIHLLTDGILRIEYKRDENDEYRISSLLYNKDFALEGFAGKTYYKILEQDYVSKDRQ